MATTYTVINPSGATSNARPIRANNKVPQGVTYSVSPGGTLAPSPPSSLRGQVFPKPQYPTVPS